MVRRELRFARVVGKGLMMFYGEGQLRFWCWIWCYCSRRMPWRVASLGRCTSVPTMLLERWHVGETVGKEFKRQASPSIKWARLYKIIIVETLNTMRLFLSEQLNTKHEAKSKQILAMNNAGTNTKPTRPPATSFRKPPWLYYYKNSKSW